MSTIDGYKHTALGFVLCPSRYAVTFPHKSVSESEVGQVMIYRLDEDIVHERAFDGKRGDILVGGGRGEAAALRIAVPEAFLLETHESWGALENLEDVYKAFWTMRQAYIFCDGYSRVGWSPEQEEIEPWLTGHVLSFLLRHYPDQYACYLGAIPLDQDGSICRLLTEDEAQV